MRMGTGRKSWSQIEGADHGWQTWVVTYRRILRSWNCSRWWPRRRISVIRLVIEPFVSCMQQKVLVQVFQQTKFLHQFSEIGRHGLNATVEY